MLPSGAKAAELPIPVTEQVPQRVPMVLSLDLYQQWCNVLLAGTSYKLAENRKHWEAMKKAEARYHTARGAVPPVVSKPAPAKVLAKAA